MYLIGKNNLDLIYLNPTTHKATPIEVIKYFKGYTYINNNELLITEYKNKFEIKQSKKLIKGDNIFLIMDWKEIRKFNFNKEAFINGMCIYQVYNDDTQMFDILIKGLSYEYIKENYEDFLKENWFNIEKYKNNAKLIPDTNTNIINITELSFTDKDIDYILSYLAWMIVFYGNINIKNKNLINIKIDINLDGLWIMEEQLFELKQKLQDNKILLNISFDNNRLSITSYDYEFENFIKDVFEINNIEIIKYKKSLVKKEELKKYLKKEVKGIENTEEIDKLFENNIKIIES